MLGDGFPWDLFFIALTWGIVNGKNKAIELREAYAATKEGIAE
ncbi:MAG: hypothetical protein AAFQ83_21615 [Bacteroidota bacterium]